MKKSAYITIGGEPLCDYTGCVAGTEQRRKAEAVDPGANVVCGHGTIKGARRAAKALAPGFRSGVVKVVVGTCPAMTAAIA